MKKILWYYWYFAKGIRGYAIATMVLFTAGFIVNAILRPIVIKDIIDGFVRNSPDIWKVMLMFVLTLVLKEVLFRTGDVLITSFEARHMRLLRKESLREILKHSLGFFSQTFTGSLVAKHKRFITAGESIFDEVAYQHVFILVQIIGILIVSASISPYLVAGYVFWTIVAGILIAVTFKKRVDLDTQEAAVESRAIAHFADIVGNISIVKLFGKQEKEQSDFDRTNTEHYHARTKAWTYSNRQNMYLGICTTGMYATTLWIGWLLRQSGHLTPGEISLVLTYSATLSETMWMSARSLRKYTKGLADAAEMIDIIEKPGEINDSPNAFANVDANVHGITFDKVTFAHKGGQPLFRDFSLRIDARQKVAVIGSTGAGKTTLVNLLLRNIEVQSGSIRIEPYDIRTDITQDGLKSLISTVSQYADMFHRTIRENIAYGKQGATDEEVIEAAKKARIHEFIIQQTDGYDTKVGERGVHLSGGQKQRIAIARALLHDAPVLILDEATSSLDNVTEKEIQLILETGLKEKTVIVIAHRLSTIRNCDRIIVLEHGSIIQDGTHDELILDVSGIYYKMLHSSEVARKEEIVG